MPASPGEIAPRRFGLPHPRHFFALSAGASTRRAGARPFSKTIQGVTVAVPDSLLPAVAFDAYLGETGNPARLPALDERFLPPREFVWGSFTASDGAVLRWGHLPVPESIPRRAPPASSRSGSASSSRSISRRCAIWRRAASRCGASIGAARDGRSGRRRFPTRPRARNFNRDAEDLAEFARAICRPVCRASWWRIRWAARSRWSACAAIPDLFAGAALSSPMVGLRTDACRRPWCAC